jgi:signal transduction histidine kinase/DNA-binding response OmpR family regulator
MNSNTDNMIAADIDRPKKVKPFKKPNISNQEILVVDDNPTNLKLIHELLALHGYKVRLATGGQMAIRSAISNQPSLILLDITMPEMDGFEVCEQLKKNPVTNSIPVIFLSALKEELDIVKGFKVGGVDFVSKPFKSEVLLSRIKTHITIDSLQKELFTINNNLEQEVRERTQTINHVYKLSQSLTKEIKIKPLFKKLIPILLDNCQADYICIVQNKEGILKIKTSCKKSNPISFYDDEDQLESEMLYPASIVEYVAESNLPYQINNIEHDAFQFHTDSYFKKQTPNSIICFPIHFQNKQLGAVYLESNTERSEFNNNDIKFIEILMSQVSFAIENAQLYDELEQKVEERTAELKSTQNELMKNERLATLGKLTASVAHELRHPLGTISSSTYALRHKLEDTAEPIEKILTRIDRNVHRCDGIISEMLEFTREKSMQLESTLLEKWLPEVFEELDTPQGINLELLLNPVPPVDIDKDRFRRIIINLFNNACQAMTDPAVENELTTEEMKLTVETLNDDNHVMVIISDTGPGIPDDIKKHIFEPLYSTKSFGVGLGLPIVKQIVEKHKGSLEIETKPGQGTKVICKIPVTD